MLQIIPNAPSTFLWAMSDARSRMIHYFESILFEGLIKPIGKPVNRFTNQFKRFVQFPAARAESSEAVLTQITSRELMTWLWIYSQLKANLHMLYGLLAMKIFR